MGLRRWLAVCTSTVNGTSTISAPAARRWSRSSAIAGSSSARRPSPGSSSGTTSPGLAETAVGAGDHGIDAVDDLAGCDEGRLTEVDRQHRDIRVLQPVGDQCLLGALAQAGQGVGQVDHDQGVAEPEVGHQPVDLRSCVRGARGAALGQDAQALVAGELTVGHECAPVEGLDHLAHRERVSRDGELAPGVGVVEVGVDEHGAAAVWLDGARPQDPDRRRLRGLARAALGRADRDHRGMGAEQDLAESGEVGRREPWARRSHAPDERPQAAATPRPADGGSPHPAFPAPRTGCRRKPCGTAGRTPRPPGPRAESPATAMRARRSVRTAVDGRGSERRMPRCRFTTRLHIRVGDGTVAGKHAARPRRRRRNPPVAPLR